MPSSIPKRLALLVEKCWSQSPADRPDIRHVIDEITDIDKETLDNEKSDNVVVNNVNVIQVTNATLQISNANQLNIKNVFN